MASAASSSPAEEALPSPGMLVIGWYLGYGRAGGGPLLRTPESGIAFNLHATYRYRIEDSSLHLGFRPEYAVSHWESLQGVGTDELTLHQFLFNAVMEFEPQDSDLATYLLLGGGAVQYDLKRPGPNTTLSGGALQVGVGARYYLGDTLGANIGPELTLLKDFSSVNAVNLRLSFGLGLHFR